MFYDHRMEFLHIEREGDGEEEEEEEGMELWL